MLLSLKPQVRGFGHQPAGPVNQNNELKMVVNSMLELKTGVLHFSGVVRARNSFPLQRGLKSFLWLKHLKNSSFFFFFKITYVDFFFSVSWKISLWTQNHLDGIWPPCFKRGLGTSMNVILWSHPVSIHCSVPCLQPERAEVCILCHFQTFKTRLLCTAQRQVLAHMFEPHRDFQEEKKELSAQGCPQVSASEW